MARTLFTMAIAQMSVPVIALVIADRLCCLDAQMQRTRKYKKEGLFKAPLFDLDFFCFLQNSQIFLNFLQMFNAVFKTTSQKPKNLRISVLKHPFKPFGRTICPKAKILLYSIEKVDET